MYRDDPLDDEAELRAIIGDDAVDALVAARPACSDDPVGAAVDALRVLQGWVDDDAAAAWFRRPQRRLDGDAPIEALARDRADEVLDAAQAWAAAQT